MRAPIRILCVLGLAAFCVTCGGGGGGGASPVSTVPPADPITVTVDVGIKQLNFSWTELPGSTHYRLLENPDGHSGFTQVGADIPADTLSASLAISVHMFDFANALYIVEGCDASGCTGSTEVNVVNDMVAAIGYFKASNTDMDDFFGDAIALSADGKTLAVGSHREDSSATGINGDGSDNSAEASGAVYVFRHDGTDWFQRAYVKASNTNGVGANPDQADQFGRVIALSADGNTLAVGANGEASGATGINGNQDDNSTESAGAVYVFRFDGTDWFQQAYVKASNTDTVDQFGYSVALSADGNTLAVAAAREDSNATGINGDQNDNSAVESGAVYVFRFDGADWFQQAYVKASNTETSDLFGRRVALNADGNTLAVAAAREDSNATGINEDELDNSAESAGAVYVFRFDGTAWFQQAYVKASNTNFTFGDEFGTSIALSADSTMLAIGARNESSCALGVGGDQNDDSCSIAGAAYVFRFDGTDWAQTAYVKASNTDGQDQFGRAIALNADGTTLAVGAASEKSLATGIGGDQTDNSASTSPSLGNAGAVYVY